MAASACFRSSTTSSCAPSRSSAGRAAGSPHHRQHIQVDSPLIVAGEINLGGSIEPLHNPVTLAEIAVEKGAATLLMPVACRRQLFDLSDEMATKVDIQFYLDARDVLLKALVE